MLLIDENDDAIEIHEIITDENLEVDMHEVLDILVLLDDDEVLVELDVIVLIDDEDDDLDAADMVDDEEVEVDTQNDLELTDEVIDDMLIHIVTDAMLQTVDDEVDEDTNMLVHENDEIDLLLYAIQQLVDII